MDIDLLLDVLGALLVRSEELPARLAEVTSKEEGQGLSHWETKTLGGVLYRSIRSWGISLQYEPATAQQPTCMAIDLYNGTYGKGWSTFLGLPVTLNVQPTTTTSPWQTLRLDPLQTGRDLVTILGEPDRKGGGDTGQGDGTDAWGPGVWMEWKRVAVARTPASQPATSAQEDVDSMDLDIMVELAGDGARGADRWDRERAGIAKWGVLTLSMSNAGP